MNKPQGEFRRRVETGGFGESLYHLCLDYTSESDVLSKGFAAAPWHVIREINGP